MSADELFPFAGIPGAFIHIKKPSGSKKRRIMQINTALDKIFVILDEDDPVKHADTLRSLLSSIQKGLHRSGLDDEIIDCVSEYVDTWTVDEAIEEDIDSFIEETNDIYERVVGEDEDEDDDEDEDEDDEY